MSVNVPRTGLSARTVAAAALVAGSLGFAGWWAASARAESPAPAAPVVAAQSQPAARAGRSLCGDVVRRRGGARRAGRGHRAGREEGRRRADGHARRRCSAGSSDRTHRPRIASPASAAWAAASSCRATGTSSPTRTSSTAPTRCVSLLHDGREFDGKVIGVDKASDLAVLDIKATNLPIVPLADSNKARVGDVVLAVGNPLGVGETVTMGILSAKGRTTSVGDGSYEDFLQTDAPINRGNSGGALVTAQRRAGRHHVADPDAVGRQHRHRLRHSVQHGEERDGSAHLDPATCAARCSA